MIIIMVMIMIMHDYDYDYGDYLEVNYLFFIGVYAVCWETYWPDVSTCLKNKLLPFCEFFQNRTAYDLDPHSFCIFHLICTFVFVCVFFT